MPHAVIRADASTSLGSGHIMRCLALAIELRSQRWNVSFVCREDPGHLCDLVEEFGFTVFRLPFLPALPESWENDAEATRRSVGSIDVSWLIIDHYGLDARWELKMSMVASRLMVIDDLANRSHYCNLLLDQNLHAEPSTRYSGLVPISCQILLGPEFAILRREFRVEHDIRRKRDGGIRRILVFFGGSDPTNETVKALLALKAVARTNINVDVVVGTSNTRRLEIERFCQHIPRVSYHCQTNKMAQLMGAADLAIGAGGSATWERCCVGLPALIISVAENQTEISAQCAEAGAAIFLGCSDTVDVPCMRDAISALLRDAGKVADMSRKASTLVDGRGTTRVSALLE